MKNSVFLLFLVGVLSGCNCGAPLTIRSIQSTDKDLACQDIILEMNEAEFYREEARKYQSIGLGEILMPTCWVAGYIDGDKGMKSANARIEYLGRIYDLLECGGREVRTPPAALQYSPIPGAVVGGAAGAGAGAYGAPPAGYPSTGAPPPGVIPSPSQVAPPITAQPPVATNEESVSLPDQKSSSERRQEPIDRNLHIHADKKTGHRYMHSHEHKSVHKHDAQGNIIYPPAGFPRPQQ